ncbi:DUF4265 domain-containing protein [Myxococcus stipitatus]|uniref:DUF4265 domain-containing protein n=1 Tax=Myxococcus stipitatus TaxID=83455 RepID=UPI001F397544|nr:DUF4265 domain-containing protein [Myxococcus stipitatus]MCE9673131.1 DUF4265 domain-containing protein [Myxococcus stipitatus]
MHVKILFPFTNSSGDTEIESMWAVKRDDGYEIDNIPFYVKSLAWGDVVSARADADGAWVYEALVRPSGHSTIHLLFEREGDVPRVRDELTGLGCSSEVSNLPSLIAVDVPPAIPYEGIKRYLEQGEAAGTFEYQEACLGFL